MRVTILAAAAVLTGGHGALAQLHPAGELVVWGPGATGPMLPPANLGPVVDVWATYQTVFARRPDGSIVAWGNPSAPSTTVPTNVGDVRALSGTRGCPNRIVALRSDGTLLSWGGTCYEEPNPLPQGVRLLADGSSGAFHVVAKQDDSLVAWGFFSGSLGMPSSIPGVRCIAKVQDYVVAARGDGTLVTWGWGPEAPAAAAPARKLVGAAQQVISLREDGSLVTWGEFSSPPVEPPPAGSFEDVSAGPFTFVARRADGTLAVWGRSASELVPPAKVRFSKAVVGVNAADHPTAADDFPLVIAIRYECIADLNVDGQVDGVDLGVLLACWGPTTSAAACQRSDLNRDGAVDGVDLGVLLSRWGTCTN